MSDNRLFDASEAEKRCVFCGRMLPASWFNLSRKARDGLQSYCRDCQMEYKRRHPFREFKYKQGTKEGINGLFDEGWIENEHDYLH